MLRHWFLSTVCGAVVLGATTQPPPPPPPPPLNAVQHVHDPCIIRDGQYFYVFSTGPGIPVRRSRDLIQWEFVGKVFKEAVPAWAVRDIPGASSLWAPDISRVGSRFRLYYSVSTFGSNRSLIGLATSPTLDPARPDYGWRDEGLVVESMRTSDYNAIDPNLAQDARGNAYLSFGSFWHGIRQVQLDALTGKPAPNAPLTPLAERPAPDALEAPFVTRRGRWYYLWTSWDLCCRGVLSTYNVRVGRSVNIAGPYRDRAGVPLLQGGGTSVLATQGNAIGPGHCALLHEGKRDFLTYHFYDGENNGVPTLQVRALEWDKNDWPVAGAPLRKETPEK